MSTWTSFFFFRYRGTYCSQDVAIKVFKPEHVSVDMQREFAQEVYIMRSVKTKKHFHIEKCCFVTGICSFITAKRKDTSATKC